MYIVAPSITCIGFNFCYREHDMFKLEKYDTCHNILLLDAPAFADVHDHEHDHVGTVVIRCRSRAGRIPKDNYYGSQVIVIVRPVIIHPCHRGS